MTERFAAEVIRWRWAIIILALVMVGLIASGASKIGFSSNYRVFFSTDNEQLVAFETLQTTYEKSDNLLLVLEPKDGAIFSVKTLAAIKDLTERGWQVPYSTRVDSLSNFQHTEADGDDLIVGDLIESPEQADLDKVKQIALNEPLLIHRLIAPDARVSAVNITVQLPQKSELELPAIVAYARDMVKQFNADYPDINVYMTGSVMLGNAFAEASKHDLMTLFPIMFMVIALTLWLLLRSFTCTLATMAVIVLSIITAMGMFGWLGWTLTGPSASAPTIIITMAVADCVHILVSFLYNMRHGMAKDKAMQESIRINLQPVFITSLTTVLGFMTMNFSEVPPFRDLGNTVAMGVIAAFFFSILLLPALVMVLPVRPGQVKTGKTRAVDRIGEYVIQHRRRLLIGSVVISALLFAAIPLNQINDEFVGYFKESVKFRQDTDFTAEHLSGIYTMEYSLLSGQSDGISSPEFLKQVEAFSDHVKTYGEVIHVETITHIFKRLNKNMHGDDNAWYKLPESKELGAQYLLLYEMSLPFGLDLNNQLNVDKSSVRVRITLKNISSRRTLQLEETFAAWLKANTSIQEFYAASPNIMFSHIGERNAYSMVKGVGYALIIICLIMTLVLKSVKLGVFSMIPNLIPIGAAFGIWGLAHGDVGISIGTAVGMILGIVIDDTVHFLSKYQRARREKNLSAEDAIRYAFSTVGTALWVTTFVLVAGFGVLAASEFNMNSYMGIFTACTITLALLFDFLVLPALLLKLESKRPFQDEAMSSDNSASKKAAQEMAPDIAA